MKFLFLLALVVNLACVGNAENLGSKEKTLLFFENAEAMKMAEATLNAHGGAKFRAAKSVVMRGAVEVSAPNSSQTLPAAFSIIYAGEKYRFELTAPPIINFLQSSDGLQTYSSMPGISLPPINRLGLPLLSRIGDAGFAVSALPEKFSKKKGFRLTSPEGFYTDFIVDGKTALVKEYESSYDFNGRTITTSVAIDKFRDINGVIINEVFSQRLETGRFTAYAKFKARQILLDSELAADVFVIAR